MMLNLVFMNRLNNFTFQKLYKENEIEYHIFKVDN